jgi:flagellar hook-basal body complex protein FliE
MSLPIASVTSALPAALAPAGTHAAAGSGFRDLLEGAIQRVDTLKQAADQGIERVLAGEGQELHGVVLATQRAELAFELFMQVRNKVTAAYQEVMRMQI